MQKRPSMVYIRRRCCSRRTVRCCAAFIILLMLMFCLHIKLIWALIWAGIFTGLFRLFIIGKFLQKKSQKRNEPVNKDRLTHDVLIIRRCAEPCRNEGSECRRSSCREYHQQQRLRAEYWEPMHAWFSCWNGLPGYRTSSPYCKPHRTYPCIYTSLPTVSILLKSNSAILTQGNVFCKWKIHCKWIYFLIKQSFAAAFVNNVP